MTFVPDLGGAIIDVIGLHDVIASTELGQAKLLWVRNSRDAQHAVSLIVDVDVDVTRDTWTS